MNEIETQNLLNQIKDKENRLEVKKTFKIIIYQLNLSNLNIQFLPDNLSDLTQLTSLNISNNPISNVNLFI